MPISFFLAFPSLPRFTKDDVDAGNVGEDAAALCDAIRAVFFLSRAIRKERTLWLSFAADRALVAMAGGALRYLGPDERSTLMLVDKAAGVLRSNPGGWAESTPGVSCLAGVDPGTALSRVASEHPGLAIVAPAFTTVEPAGRPAIAFPPELPALAATRGAVLAMALDGSHAASWPGSPTASGLPEHFITADVKVTPRFPTLASRILAINLIEDNAGGAWT
ncbi:MAG: hypothetical protein JW839_10165 [Candidatus Lokiarchaeota archaeon]|nr:hypothetical protein [Candidatus Lokiarchaeota archaeon]